MSKPHSRSTLVVLDDDVTWCTLVRTEVLANPEAEGVRVTVFHSDEDATRFVKEYASDIFAFIQDLNAPFRQSAARSKKVFAFLMK
jgi:hypothetical protein